MRHFSFYILICCWLLPVVAVAQQRFCGSTSFTTTPVEAAVQRRLDSAVAAARQKHEADTLDAEALIWYGRREAYRGHYNEAVALFTKGIRLHPADARFYRHRGHRYLTLRCVDAAISDLTQAAALTKGRPDEVEPDGIPNSRNQPTSTLQGNIWYHLGLAYYLKGNFEAAAQAYQTCLLLSTHPDMYVATANWYYITLLQLQRRQEAAALLQTVNPRVELIENEGYLTILLLYKGLLPPEQLYQQLQEAPGGLASTTLQFGLANYYRLNGQAQRATELFRQIVNGNQWGSFAYMAAAWHLAH